MVTLPRDSSARFLSDATDNDDSSPTGVGILLHVKQNRTMSAYHRVLLVVSCLILLLSLLALAGCRPFRHAADRPPTAEALRAQAYCPIDGLPTTKRAIYRRPLAVMIENSPKARPQSGLRSACAVYEAITEGGITRFLAVYLHADPAVIGPVRSARPHFINIAREYNAGYVHCGQSYEALQILVTDPTIYNLDQMKYPAPFWRDHSRKAPHNLYASAAKLRRLLRARQWEMPVSPLPIFTSSAKTFSGQPAKTIAISFPGATHYTLRLVYDAKQGGYLRYMDGTRHVDRETRQPIVAKNVIVQRVSAMPYSNSTHGTVDVEMVGNGRGIFLRDGQQTALRWQKTNASAITQYTDLGGGALPFRNGQTWVEIVPIGGMVRIDGLYT